MSLLTDVSTSYLGHIETLRVIPSKQIIEEICSALDLPEDYLFPTSLMEALRGGLFELRVAELEEKQIVRLAEVRRAGLLPPGIAEDEAIETIQRDFDKDLLKKLLPEVLGALKPRERAVLELRFGLRNGNSRTLEEVGKEFGVNRERIRQIEAKALRKLRHPSRSRQLKDYLY